MSFLNATYEPECDGHSEEKENKREDSGCQAVQKCFDTQHTRLTHSLLLFQMTYCPPYSCAPIAAPYPGYTPHTTVEAWGRPVWKKSWLFGKWKYAGVKDVTYIPRTHFDSTYCPAPTVAPAVYPSCPTTLSFCPSVPTQCTIPSTTLCTSTACMPPQPIQTQPVQTQPIQSQPIVQS